MDNPLIKKDYITTTQKITFNNKQSREFAKEVKQRVNEYFESQGISENANAAMVWKTIIILALYLIPYGLIISGLFNIWMMFGLCVVMGIGMAGIGFSIAHDALHGAYSSKSWVNKILGFSFDFLGANGYIWKITHNVIHHTYTNIYGKDEDLDVAGFIRLCPHAPYKKIHRIQPYLAFFAYSLATISWVLFKDYYQFSRTKLGPYIGKKHPVSEWAILIIGKIVYYGYFFVLPALLLNIAWWQLLIGYLVVHLTAGLILGIVFQLAHTVEQTSFPVVNEENVIEQSWMIHEMETTADFARNNRFLSWYIGGLNFQIEHHLFPRVCSIHYPQISPIVEEVANKYGVPFHSHETFGAAIKSHYRTLKKFSVPPAETASLNLVRT